jgi:hypothetical protein
MGCNTSKKLENKNKSLHFGAFWLSTHSTNGKSDSVIGKISFRRILNTPCLRSSNENWLISQQIFKMSTLTLERAPLVRGPQIRFPLKQRLRHWVDNGRFQGESSLRSGTRSNWSSLTFLVLRTLVTPVCNLSKYLACPRALWELNKHCQVDVHSRRTSQDLIFTNKTINSPSSNSTLLKEVEWDWDWQTWEWQYQLSWRIQEASFNKITLKVKSSKQW